MVVRQPSGEVRADEVAALIQELTTVDCVEPAVDSEIAAPPARKVLALDEACRPEDLQGAALLESRHGAACRARCPRPMGRSRLAHPSQRPTDRRLYGRRLGEAARARSVPPSIIVHHAESHYGAGLRARRVTSKLSGLPPSLKAQWPMARMRRGSLETPAISP